MLSISDKLIASLREALEIQSDESVATIHGLSSQIERLTSYSYFSGSASRYGSRDTKESYKLLDDAETPDNPSSMCEEKVMDGTAVSAHLVDEDNHDTEGIDIEHEHSVLMARSDARLLNASHDGKLQLHFSEQALSSCHNQQSHEQIMPIPAEDIEKPRSPSLTQNSWEAKVPSQCPATQTGDQQNEVMAESSCGDAAVLGCESTTQKS